MVCNAHVFTYTFPEEGYIVYLVFHEVCPVHFFVHHDVRLMCYRCLCLQCFIHCVFRIGLLEAVGYYWFYVRRINAILPRTRSILGWSFPHSAMGTMLLSCSAKDPNKVSLATLNWEHPNSNMIWYTDVIGNQVIFMNPPKWKPQLP